MDDVRSIQASPAGREAAPQESLEEFAKKIDFQILDPALTEDQLYDRCLTARQWGVAAVVVRGCDADSALRRLHLGVIRVGAVAGHPYGGSSSAVKVYEARDLLRRGVKQINAYPNPGKLLSRQFQHQEVELIQLADACIEAGAALKVMLDNALLDDEMKIVLCRMAKRVNANFVSTTEPRDLELLLKHCGNRVKVECGGVRTIEEARRALAIGCASVASVEVAGILRALEVEAAGATKSGA